MRKHREKMKQQQQEQHRTASDQHQFYTLSKKQQEAYAKFEKEFVRRIDQVLNNKVGTLGTYPKFFLLIYLVYFFS